MKISLIRWLLFSALIALFVLHKDFWFWRNPTLVIGLPVGLVYHIMFCAAVTVLMVLLVRYAWPSHLEIDEDTEDK
ncbi:MAG: hypothetical protein OXN17_12455 [Candidatus Poribacteria bacterium]|nr:hypothetical protein [Candidatus Poribacteria bacterium]MDE0502471.1 hypothetical protein [Candidatus Poribacteria bacterium]